MATLLPALLAAQADTAVLLGRWYDPALQGSAAYNNTYNEVWGLAVNGREYGVIGSTFGTHLIDITDPKAPKQIDYLNTRENWTASFDSKSALAGTALSDVGDLGPEGLHFISAAKSPNGKPLLMVGNEVSGTTTIVQVDLVP